jgi:hypothetical protein
MRTCRKFSFIHYVIAQLTVRNCPTQQDDIIETINDISLNVPYDTTNNYKRSINPQRI